jgi:endonuclease/exonuclease/phosphatase (EEP) superfamily protein YafD
MATARWHTPSFQHAGNFISQSIFSKQLDWVAVSGCLATEVTRPYSFGLLFLGTYEVPAVCSEVKHYG